MERIIQRDIFERALVLILKVNPETRHNSYDCSEMQSEARGYYEQYCKLTDIELASLHQGLLKFPDNCQNISLDPLLSVVYRMVKGYEFSHHCHDCGFPKFIYKYREDLEPRDEVCPFCGD